MFEFEYLFLNIIYIVITVMLEVILFFKHVFKILLFYYLYGIFYSFHMIRVLETSNEWLFTSSKNINRSTSNRNLKFATFAVINTSVF